MYVYILQWQRFVPKLFIEIKKCDMSGPLTNIALAMKLDPGLPTRLKEIFIMGGNTGYD